MIADAVRSGNTAPAGRRAKRRVRAQAGNVANVPPADYTSSEVYT